MTTRDMIINERNSIYDELCRVLTDYEGNGDDEYVPNPESLYDMLVKIQNNWDDITSDVNEY